VEFHLFLLSLVLTLGCSHAVLCYAVESLKVKHVIVMGHYRCGGVAASMVAPPPQSTNLAVQNWIYPIRQIYETSKRFVDIFCQSSLKLNTSRPEIAGHRTNYANGRSDTSALHDRTFFGGIYLIRLIVD